MKPLPFSPELVACRAATEIEVLLRVGGLGFGRWSDSSVGPTEIEVLKQLRLGGMGFGLWTDSSVGLMVCCLLAVGLLVCWSVGLFVSSRRKRVVIGYKIRRKEIRYKISSHLIPWKFFKTTHDDELHYSSLEI
jgi:hypothetical protein